MKESHGTKEERVMEWIIGISVSLAIIWMITSTNMIKTFSTLINLMG